MGPCCVNGCNGITKDISFFEFPTRRALRTEWLKVLQMPRKVPLGTVVCSRHFRGEDYEVVRGKVRLKGKVVPSQKLTKTSDSPTSTKPPESNNTDKTRKSPNVDKKTPESSNVNKKTPELPTVNKTPGSPPADKTAESSSANKTPQSPSANKTPGSPPANKTAESSSANKTPQSPSANKTPGSPPANKTAESSSANKTPQSPSANKTPGSPPANKTPQSPSANKTPGSPPANKTPQSPSANKTPGSPPANKTAESSSANKTPQSPSANKTPGSPPANKTAESSSANKTPQSPSANKTPESLFANETQKSPTVSLTRKPLIVDKIPTSPNVTKKTAKSPNVNKTPKSPNLNKTRKSPANKIPDPKKDSELPAERPEIPLAETADTTAKNSSPHPSNSENNRGTPEGRGEKAELCRVVSKERKKSKETENRPPPTDPRQPPDFEDMITNYQIKINKPLPLLTYEMEMGVRCAETDDTIVLDGRGDEPPVFIEISVDKDNNAAQTSNEDCLMVLESVQVDVDPSALMLPETEGGPAELGVEVSEVPARKEDPISLLTSSDEDEVILQEPHIDTVEVSDETDEDDVPLVRLLSPTPKKKRLKTTHLAPSGLRKLIWSGAFDFYCMQCHFTTTNSIEYNEHVSQHNRLMQVCHVCNYTTSSSTQFARHIRKHKDEKKFKCHICNYRARHNMSLIYHIQCHERDGESIKSVKKGFKCIKCGFRSHLKVVVLNHVRTCSERGVVTYSCDQCVYVTKRKSDLKRHVSKRHPVNVVEVDCDYCLDPNQSVNLD